MRYLKIKCKKEKDYKKIEIILNIHAIEYYRPGEEKPIHVCSNKKKKEIEALLEKYKLSSKADIKVKDPDFKQAFLCVEQEEDQEEEQEFDRE